jgi:hypothetical protein
MGRASSDAITVFRIAGIVFLDFARQLVEHAIGLLGIEHRPLDLDEPWLLVNDAILVNLLFQSFFGWLAARVHWLPWYLGRPLHATKHAVREVPGCA